jgi:hypothetical protein
MNAFRQDDGVDACGRCGTHDFFFLDLVFFSGWHAA